MREGERTKTEWQTEAFTEKTLKQLKGLPSVILKCEPSVSDELNVASYVECKSNPHQPDDEDVESQLMKMFGSEANTPVTHQRKRKAKKNKKPPPDIHALLVSLFGSPLDDINPSPPKRICSDRRRHTLPVSISLDSEAIKPLSVTKKRKSETDIPCKPTVTATATAESLDVPYWKVLDLVIPPVFSEKASTTVVLEARWCRAKVGDVVMEKRSVNVVQVQVSEKATVPVTRVLSMPMLSPDIPTQVEATMPESTTELRRQRIKRTPRRSKEGETGLGPAFSECLMPEVCCREPLVVWANDVPVHITIPNQDSVQNLSASRVEVENTVSAQVSGQSTIPTVIVSNSQNVQVQTQDRIPKQVQKTQVQAISTVVQSATVTQIQAQNPKSSQGGTQNEKTKKASSPKVQTQTKVLKNAKPTQVDRQNPIPQKTTSAQLPTQKSMDEKMAVTQPQAQYPIATQAQTQNPMLQESGSAQNQAQNPMLQNTTSAQLPSAQLMLAKMIANQFQAQYPVSTQGQTQNPMLEQMIATQSRAQYPMPTHVQTQNPMIVSQLQKPTPTPVQVQNAVPQSMMTPSQVVQIQAQKRLVENMILTQARNNMILHHELGAQSLTLQPNEVQITGPVQNQAKPNEVPFQTRTPMQSPENQNVQRTCARRTKNTKSNVQSLSKGPEPQESYNRRTKPSEPSSVAANQNRISLPQNQHPPVQPNQNEELLTKKARMTEMERQRRIFPQPTLNFPTPQNFHNYVPPPNVTLPMLSRITSYQLISHATLAEKILPHMIQMEKWRIAMSKFYDEVKLFLSPDELKMDYRRLTAVAEARFKELGEKMIVQLMHFDVEKFSISEFLGLVIERLGTTPPPSRRTACASVASILMPVRDKCCTPFLKKFCYNIQVAMAKMDEKVSVGSFLPRQLDQLKLQIQQFCLINSWLVLEKQKESLPPYSHPSLYAMNEILKNIERKKIAGSSLPNVQNSQCVVSSMNNNMSRNIQRNDITINSGNCQICPTSSQHYLPSMRTIQQQNTGSDIAMTSLPNPENSQIVSTHLSGMSNVAGNIEKQKEHRNVVKASLYNIPENSLISKPQETVNNQPQNRDVNQIIVNDLTVTRVSIPPEVVKIPKSEDDDFDVQIIEDESVQPSSSIKKQTKDEKEEVIDLTWIDDGDENDIVEEIIELKLFPFKFEDSDEATDEETESRRNGEVDSPSDSGVGSPMAQNDGDGRYRCLCGNKAIFVCACKASMYCSPGCQSRDWVDHQTLCQKPKQ